MLLKFVTNQNFPIIKCFCIYMNFYKTVQSMNTGEDKSQQGKMNTPTPEAELVVELNSNILDSI